MTANSQPQIGGEPVGDFLLRRHDALVRSVLNALVEEIPVYARLPKELVEGDVRRVVDQALRLFTASLDRGGRAEAAGMLDLTESAANRAEEGVPMEMVLAAYFRGARIAADAAVAVARPDEHDDIRSLVGAVMTFMEEAASAVAAGYARFGRTAQAEQASARQLLVNALLEGGNVREAAGPAEVRLPPTYLVVSIAAGQHPDENDPDVDRVVATRRKLRRLREELERHYAEPVLWMPATDGGLALVPDDNRERLAEVMTAVRRTTGADVHAGVAAASPEDVPAAGRLAREVVEVARDLGRSSGVYALDDVALEYQLRRFSEAQPLLAALLDPIDDQPDLSATLATFLATGLNRRRSAQRLHVHPNTVDNRLRKVAALTGLDASDPADLPTITAALAARRSRP